MSRTKQLQKRIAITLERIEMFNGMIERSKKFMPNDVNMLKDRENIRTEMVKELYALLAELGIYNPQQDIWKHSIFCRLIALNITKK